MPSRLQVTMRTHEVFGLAHDLAARLGHAEVTPVHVLLAVVREGRSPAVVVLHNLGVRTNELEAELEKNLPASSAPRVAEYSWTEGDVGMLHKAALEATELGHEYQGCEHILLAMLRDRDSIPTMLLARHNVGFEDAQAEVLRILGSPRGNGGIGGRLTRS